MAEGRSIRSAVQVDPVHSLGGVVFGEIYNLQRPTIAKMMDGGRNTDMDAYGPGGFADVKVTTYKGFPSQLHDMIASSDAAGLEALLSATSVAQGVSKSSTFVLVSTARGA